MNKKIAIFCLHYGGLTGSEIYFYELIKILKEDFDISIYSNIDYSFKEMTIFDDVTYYNLNDHCDSASYDLILLSHGNYIINNLKKYITDYSNTPIMNIVHSEVLPMEAPLLDDSIDVYVGIRQSIIDHLIYKHNIPKNQVKLIHNPVDTKRFNHFNITKEGFGVFIGTMNHLRFDPFIDFINVCNRLNLNVKYIGDIDDDTKFNFTNVEFIKPIFGVENYIKKSNLIGGILQGRTYWESKLCMKDTLEYNVDEHGTIIDKKFEGIVNCDHIKNWYIKNQFNSLIYSLLDKLK
jgi:hypothetical protein